NVHRNNDNRNNYYSKYAITTCVLGNKICRDKSINKCSDKYPYKQIGEHRIKKCPCIIQRLLHFSPLIITEKAISLNGYTLIGFCQIEFGKYKASCNTENT